MKRKNLLIFIFANLLLFGSSCDNTDKKPKEIDNSTGSVFIKNNYEKKIYRIKMRDGVRLFTIIYSPIDKSKKYPILLTRTPYSVRPYEEDQFPEKLGTTNRMAREKYIFAYQDIRGAFINLTEYL